MKGHIATLDALRGVAAVAVVILHMNLEAAVGPFPPRAFLAVDFFFVLSGFVIARAYEERLLTDMSVWAFMRARLIRLYPLIALGTVLGFAAKFWAYTHGGDSRISSVGAIVQSLACGLLLLPSSAMYGHPMEFALNPPAWSLMFEVWANVLYGIVVSRFTTAMLWVVVATGSLALCLEFLQNPDLDGEYAFGAARVGFSFFAGVLIHRLFPPSAVGQLPRVPFTVIVAALIGTFMLPADSSIWYAIAAVLGVYPLIVILSLRDPISSRWRLAGLLAGVLSYPIYILHWPTVVHMQRFRGMHGWVAVAVVTGGITAITLISLVAVRWYDEPLRRRLNQRARRLMVVTFFGGRPSA